MVNLGKKSDEKKKIFALAKLIFFGFKTAGNQSVYCQLDSCLKHAGWLFLNAITTGQALASPLFMTVRNFDRHGLSAYGVVQNENTSKRVLIQDFSRMGVGFVSEDFIQAKTFVSLLYQNENQQIIQMKSYIKHVRKLKDGLYFIGVQFVAIEAKFKSSI